AQTAGPKGVHQGQHNGAGGGQRLEKMVQAQNKIFAQLNLTAAQKAKVAAVEKKHMAAFKAMFEARSKNKGTSDGEPSRSDRKAQFEKMKSMHQEYEKDIKAILTPAQAAKYDSLRKAQMGQFGGRRGGGAAGGTAKRD
ncbi:MAG: Spy/CpxP family protein refolding chaperone, partial [Terriglobales bacterium]